MTARSFREAYTVLQQHAEKLRNQREPNIDDLLTIVTESVDAYKVCKERIDAVEKALEHALGSAGFDAPVPEDGPSGNAPGPMEARPSPAQRTSFDDMDDDIPF